MVKRGPPGAPTRGTVHAGSATAGPTEEPVDDGDARAEAPPRGLARGLLMTQPVLPREAQADEVRDLIARGQSAGFLTSDDVGAALVAAELPPEATDTILAVIA